MIREAINANRPWEAIRHFQDLDEWQKGGNLNLFLNIIVVTVVAVVLLKN